MVSVKDARNGNCIGRPYRLVEAEELSRRELSATGGPLWPQTGHMALCQ